jgi:hypothetical protein
MSQVEGYDRILKALRKGEITLQGQFNNSSNSTFLGSLKYQDLQMQIVYKPTRGERPLWDFPAGTLARREVAAFYVSDALGWELVPPTVYRVHDAPFGPGSLQEFIDYDPQYHYFTFSESDRHNLQNVVLFDLLCNNADRKGGHIFFGKDDHHLWIIDHGICFNITPKLRTVIWDFAGEEIESGVLEDIKNFVTELKHGKGVFSRIRTMLLNKEVDALIKRGEDLIDTAVFPYPSSGRPYPWPPI